MSDASVAGDRREHKWMAVAMGVLTVAMILETRMVPYGVITAFISGYAYNAYLSHPYVAGDST